ncbi:Uncharacterized protein APZ42_014466 [Daphnia magna]|uniref:Uncharacterized protein n=1 Tax=Daphnia magna TaxID=35525 RepID=A0A162PVF8_9CRUS|nr:Uncharacterized protein APZ42_014466 [Daphnia magna]
MPRGKKVSNRGKEPLPRKRSRLDLDYEESHEEEFEAFSAKKNHNQPLTRSYSVHSKMSQGRQQQLDIGLAKMFGEDNLQLNLLRRTGFRNWIKTKLHKEIETKVANKLSQCRSLNNIMDIWSSKSMDGHTSQAILAEYEQLLQDWKIPSNKVSRIMTEGGSNMVAAGFHQIQGGNQAKLQMNQCQMNSLTLLLLKPKIASKIVHQLLPLRNLKVMRFS